MCLQLTEIKQWDQELSKSIVYLACTDLLSTSLENKALILPMLHQALFTSVDSMKAQESICAELIAETPPSILSLIL